MITSDEHEDKDAIFEEQIEIVNYLPDADTTCTICHAEFLDPDDLKIHLDQVHKILSAVVKKCHFCVEEYSDLMEYAAHIRDFHLDSLKCCTYCWRVFDDFDQHRSHCKKHVISRHESTYKCSQCEQRYADLLMLKTHEFEHKSNKDGVMLHEVLPYLSAMLKVKAITFLETLGTDVVYICVGCEFSTVHMVTYLKHVRSNACQVFVCHKCGNVFKRKRTIAKHVHSLCNMFGAKERRTRLCPDCNTHINLYQYAKHKIRCKSIKCYACDITFNSMNDWSEHQSTDHAGLSVEVETCQYCWKRCVGSVAMQKHIDKTHRPEFHLYKYLCVYCNSVFKHPQKLFGHFVTKHKEISPYTCKICDKKFRYRKKFTIHIKLSHKSIGFVEFDENYHVFFTDTKSKNPFIPKSIYTEDIKNEDENIEDKSEDVGLNSDFVIVTEMEGNKTEAENKYKPKLKRKRTSKVPNDSLPNKVSVELESSDDNETLQVVRKRFRLQKKQGFNAPIKRRRVRLTNKNLLTCNICKKYCYTFQNYNHHVSLHSKHEVKKCIICSKIFKSKNKLNEHIASEHSSSKLTETLKTLLEKRKTGGSLIEDLPTSIKFRRTIRKVNAEITTTSAKITVVDHKLSVQKFLENFVPEESKVELPINNTASIKIVTGYRKEPMIKMTKFKPSPPTSSIKLSMPVKFVDRYPEKVKISIKLVQTPEIDEKHSYYSDHYDDPPDEDRHESIPEVAEEILLEGTDEAPKFAKGDVPHKIIIPKLPTELTDIRIAHLLPQAPYYKIVKVKDVLDQNEDEKDNVLPNSIKLSNGTKLVTTNPLAHLLGNQQEKVLESVKNKYYKPKKNLPGMLAKALTMLEKPTLPRKKRKEENTVDHTQRRTES